MEEKMESGNKDYKPGVKTSEFWISLAPVLMGVVEIMKGDSQNSTIVIVCATVLVAVYILSRTIFKHGSKAPSRRPVSK